MKTLIVITLAATLGATALSPPPLREGPGECAEQQPAQPTIFATIDIIIDPLGQPMGAYQFELTAADAPFMVVGVESGGHPAFAHGRPPYFDRTAEQQDTDRLIVAEYALPNLAADALPTQAVRVATVHVMFAEPIDDDAMPTIGLTLIAAGNAEGEPIDARLNFDLKTPERPE